MLAFMYRLVILNDVDRVIWNHMVSAKHFLGQDSIGSGYNWRQSVSCQYRKLLYGCIVEVWELISNFILHCVIGVITKVLNFSYNFWKRYKLESKCKGQVRCFLHRDVRESRNNPRYESTIGHFSCVKRRQLGHTRRISTLVRIPLSFWLAKIIQLVNKGNISNTPTKQSCLHIVELRQMKFESKFNRRLWLDTSCKWHAYVIFGICSRKSKDGNHVIWTCVANSWTMKWR